MATITGTISIDEIGDLVDHLSGVSLVSANDTSIVLGLVYSEEPQADQIIISGTGLIIEGTALTGGTVTGVDFWVDGISILSIQGLALSYEAVNVMLADSEAFEHYLEFLADADEDDASGDPITGDDDDDELEGTDGDDYVFGGGGDDDMYDSAGDDDYDGGSGDDTVHYEDAKKVTVNLANNTAKTSTGTDTLFNVENIVGSSGSDIIIGDANDNQLFGGNGNDKLDGAAGSDVLDGGNGNDHILGGLGDDTINAGAGNDNVIGGDGADTISGDTGNDNIDAGAGNDIVNAGAGNDNVSTGEGDDVVAGDAGNDVIVTGAGNDIVGAGVGNDKVVAGDGNDTVQGDDGNDVIMTGAGDDTVDGGNGKDTIQAGDGNDRIDGGADADAMSGGKGDDAYYVDNVKDKIAEKSGEGTDTVYASVTYSIEKSGNIENLVLQGSGDSNATGNAVINTLTGNAGDNVLNGKSGADILTGGSGDDVFVFDNLAKGGADIITDFTSGEDLISLSDAVFKQLEGVVDVTDNLVIGAAALDANDYLVFDGTTGALYYDADGNGGGAAVHIATLVGTVSLTAADFMVF